MLAESHELAREGYQEECLHALRYIALKWCQYPKTNGRANQGDLWEANRARQSADDGAGRPQLF